MTHHADSRQDVAGTDGDDESELAEDTPQGVEASGASGKRGGAQPVQSGEALLIE